MSIIAPSPRWFGNKTDRGLSPNNASLLVPMVILYGLLLLIPLLNVIRLSITSDASIGTHYARFVTDSFYLGVMLRTFRYAVITTVVSAALGYPLGYLMATAPKWLRSMIVYGVLAPLLVSGVVRAFGWMIILGRGGLLSQLFSILHISDAPISLMYTEAGAIIGLTQLYMPFLVVAVSGSVQQADFSAVRAARSLGANPIQAFSKIFFPMTFDGLMSGAMLVFSLSASAFVVPALVGGSGIPAMSYLLYKEGMQLNNWNFASAIAVLLLVLVALVNALSTAFTASRRKGGPK
jgi:putative spermidine/putrescine transport system permease protein